MITTDRVGFAGTDIGSEILPILTSGLYHDTLDALREYIQNSIDAGARHIHLSVTQSLVSITDDGSGMSQEQAVQSMRLGISDKSPTQHIGFRGIGIYSAFEICNSLEIHTKAEAEDVTYKIEFNFGIMRSKLAAERERRSLGLPPELHLEKLMHDCVFVENDSEVDVGAHGTKVLFIGIRPEAYLRLNNRTEVVEYLQNVIPLPFDPQFKFARDLSTLFVEKDYRVVDSLKLQYGSKTEELYRPYTNSLFAYKGKYPPKVIELHDPETAQRFGFAWICINDERSVLKNTNLRGLIIKKFGFSIADRRYLVPYFARTVISRRITGEIIIQNDDLIPNAARNDFESNYTRQAFLRYLPYLTREIDGWANDIQELELAIEVLSLATADLVRINSELIKARRDVDKMLDLNRQLAYVERRLVLHSKRLAADNPTGLARVEKLLSGAKDFIQTNLSAKEEEDQKQRNRVHDEVVKAVERQKIKPTRQQERIAKNIPGDLIALLDNFGLLESNDVRRLIVFINENVLRTYLDEPNYLAALRGVQEYLEGDD